MKDDGTVLCEFLSHVYITIQYHEGPHCSFMDKFLPLIIVFSECSYVRIEND